jgi:hypothetical protein
MSKAITLARKPSAARQYLETFRRLHFVVNRFEEFNKALAEWAADRVLSW